MSRLTAESGLMPSRNCFLNGYAGPKIETGVTAIGHNPAHEARLVQSLIEDYGWTEGHDGTLYPSFQEGSVA